MSLDAQHIVWFERIAAMVASRVSFNTATPRAKITLGQVCTTIGDELLESSMEYIADEIVKYMQVHKLVGTWKPPLVDGLDCCYVESDGIPFRVIMVDDLWGRTYRLDIGVNWGEIE
ncbi:MAG TPA: hypothetical protein VIY48_20195 [Candidatus Paceibacterota bacterium]